MSDILDYRGHIVDDRIYGINNRDYRRMKTCDIRSTLNMSQSEFARSISLDPSSVCAWEYGKTSPAKRTFKRILLKHMPAVLEKFEQTTDDVKDQYKQNSESEDGKEEVEQINVEEYAENETGSGDLKALNVIESWNLNYSLGRVVEFIEKSNRPFETGDFRNQLLINALFYLQREIDRTNVGIGKGKLKVAKAHTEEICKSQYDPQMRYTEGERS